jgi:hypothetical protein
MALRKNTDVTVGKIPLETLAKKAGLFVFWKL